MGGENDNGEASERADASEKADAGESETGRLPPEDAFAALGNEARVEMLQALAEADGPLRFSELRSAIGMRDSGKFNYHLSELDGHFVTEGEEGYELRRAGERVVEAVRSGAVTEAPERPPSKLDQRCEHCGAPIGVLYSEERVTVFCTECEGTYGRHVGEENYGQLGTLYLPPAGAKGRTPAELFRAAYGWGWLATLSAAIGICPRCSAALDRSVAVCETHDVSDDGVCEHCNSRYAATVTFACPNCVYERSGGYGTALLAETPLLAFLGSHGVNPIAPETHAEIADALDYEEAIESASPLIASFTFEIDGDALEVGVEEFTVTSVTRHDTDPAH